MLACIRYREVIFSPQLEKYCIEYEKLCIFLKYYGLAWFLKVTDNETSPLMNLF